MTGPQKPKLAIERRGLVVHIEVRCADHYAAMELYETAVASARDGRVTLDVQTVPRHG